MCLDASLARQVFKLQGKAKKQLDTDRSTNHYFFAGKIRLETNSTVPVIIQTEDQHCVAFTENMMLATQTADKIMVLQS